MSYVSLVQFLTVVFQSFALVDVVSAFRAHTCVYVASAKVNAAMTSRVSVSEICNG
jgi:hypothetical protein